jgi:hypothetical protein
LFLSSLDAVVHKLVDVPESGDDAGLGAAIDWMLAGCPARSAVGFDMEWVYYMSVGVPPSRTCLLQLAAPNGRVLLVRLHRTTTLPSALVSLLTNPSRTMVGNNIQNDLTKLRKDFPVQLPGNLPIARRDTSHFWNEVFKTTTVRKHKLEVIVKAVFNQRLDKTHQRACWDAETLTASLKLYACADALAVLRLHEHFVELAANPLVVPGANVAAIAAAAMAAAAVQAVVQAAAKSIAESKKMPAPAPRRSNRNADCEHCSGKLSEPCSEHSGGFNAPNPQDYHFCCRALAAKSLKIQREARDAPDAPARPSVSPEAEHEADFEAGAFADGHDKDPDVSEDQEREEGELMSVLACTALIDKFVDSAALTLALPVTLNSLQRKAIHVYAEAKGLYHRSNGAGVARCVTIFRAQPPSLTPAEETADAVALMKLSKIDPDWAAGKVKYDLKVRLCSLCLPAHFASLCPAHSGLLTFANLAALFEELLPHGHHVQHLLQVLH